MRDASTYRAAKRRTAKKNKKLWNKLPRTIDKHTGIIRVVVPTPDAKL